MSEFISNFFNYTTATLVLGAGALANFNAEPSSVARADTNVTFVDPLLLANEIHEEQIVKSVNFLVGPGDIQMAELTSVVFSSSGEDGGLGSLTTKPTGTVKGRSVNLRGGPGTGFAIAGRAAGGQQLEITGNTDGIWIEVIDPVLVTPVWIHGKFFDSPA